MLQLIKFKDPLIEDRGLVVNGQLVEVADSEENPGRVEGLAENLAAALGEALQVVEVEVENVDSWDWEEVMSRLKERA